MQVINVCCPNCSSLSLNETQVDSEEPQNVTIFYECESCGVEFWVEFKPIRVEMT